MKLTCLSEGGGFTFPPCNILNLCGFRVLLDCPVDLSALPIFSPISNCPDGKSDEHTSASPFPNSLDSLSLEQKTVKPLDAKSLIHAEPFYKTIEKVHLWNVSLIDVILISSPRGMLGLPFLTRSEGFSAKIYATEATARIGQLMMEDLIQMHMEYRQFYGPEESGFPDWMKWVELEALPLALKDIALGKDGTELGRWMALYSAADVRDCMQKVHALRYAEEACYNGTLVIKAFSTGLDIGSCNWTLKGPKRTIAYLSRSSFVSEIAMDFDFHGLQGSDIVLCSDFSSWNDTDDVGAEKSGSSLAMNDFSTMSYGSNSEMDAESLMHTDERSEEMDKLNFVCSCSVDSVQAGGSVLIPIGRLEIILQLLELFSFNPEFSTLKVPIYLISSVAEELLAFTNIIPEWLCKHRQEKLYSGESVFAHVELIKEKRLHLFPAVHSSELLMMWQEPCIVFCPHWSLRLGPVVHLLRHWCGDQNSLLVMEEGVDADLALLPFKLIAMKILQCSFLSGISLQTVPPLLMILQPKLVLLPDYMKQCIGSFSNSLPCVYYSENETLLVPKLNNFSELNIAKDLASQLSRTKLKQEDLHISRLKGELVVERGKHYLLPGNEGVLASSQTRPALQWGTLDVENLTRALQKMGINGSVERATSDDGLENCSSLHISEPRKALIEIKATTTVVTTADEKLSSLISEAICCVLNGI